MSLKEPTIFLILIISISSVFCINLMVLHTNDMHARFEETSELSGTCKAKNRGKSCLGGFARVAHEVKRIRNAGNGKQVLFLNAGDTYTGTSWFAVYKWNITLDFVNILKIDVMVSYFLKPILKLS